MTLSIDNLVSLKEKQLMESASQWADELKPLGHESLPHFSPTPILGLNRIRGFRSIDASALLVLNSEEPATAHACWFYFPVDSVFYTVCQESSLLVKQGTHVRQILFYTGSGSLEQIESARWFRRR